MKFSFSDEQKDVVGQLLANLIIKFRPARKERRHLTRLAMKFTPSAQYVWLKPKHVMELMSLLGQSMRAIDIVNEKNKPQGLLEKAKAAISTNENEEKLIKMRDTFEAVTRKLGNVHQANAR